jgi:hypothetical protein
MIIARRFGMPVLLLCEYMEQSLIMMAIIHRNQQLRPSPVAPKIPCIDRQAHCRYVTAKNSYLTDPPSITK